MLGFLRGDTFGVAHYKMITDGGMYGNKSVGSKPLHEGLHKIFFLGTNTDK